MKIIQFFSCCCNLTNSKLLNLQKTMVESDLAKAYPFKFQPHSTRLNSKTAKFFVSKEEDLNEESNQLTL